MNISKVTDCYGCMSCVDRCPKQCIEITTGKLGHLYPKIADDCIDCGLCLKVCPSVNEIGAYSALHTFAAWRSDNTLRSESSSGGMATAISEQFVNNGGIVYGCAFCKPFTFKHVRCESLEELNRLKGSKYVQSEMQGVYKNIANDLKLGKKVLFIGMPCQVSGVRMFFRNNDENLYTADLVCHGTPSVEMLKNSLPKDVFTEDVDRVEFRVNTKFHFSLKNGISTVYERPLYKDLFLKGFFTALFYRESCHTCKFANEHRISDITLGDFWGLGNDVVVDRNKGVSLCVINTEKGNSLFAGVSGVDKVRRPLKEAITGNEQLRQPMAESLQAKVFKMLYPALGFKWSSILSIPGIVIKGCLKSIVSAK